MARVSPSTSLGANGDWRNEDPRASTSRGANEVGWIEFRSDRAKSRAEVSSKLRALPEEDGEVVVGAAGGDQVGFAVAVQVGGAKCNGAGVHGVCGRWGKERG